jgi:hypothetical protein
MAPAEDEAGFEASRMLARKPNAPLSVDVFDEPSEVAVYLFVWGIRTESPPI